MQKQPCAPAKADSWPRLDRRTALTAAAALDWPARARAQVAFPSRPVRIIVPATPGGAIDITARLLAERLPASWGQSVVVENRAGANNIIGTEAIARSAPDGHTLGISAVTHAINVALYRLPFDTLRDVMALTTAYSVPLVLVAGPDFPAARASELIDRSKRRPEGVTFAGTGGITHLAWELFALQSGAKLVHVPYRGSSAAHPDLMAGRVDVMFDTMAAVLGHIRGGKLKALAISTAARSPLLPDVPTVAESGLPGFEASSWGVILAPSGLPEPVAAKISADINLQLRTAEVQERMVALGAEVRGTSVEEAQTFVRDEVAKWPEVAARVGIERQ
ncbi:tripartite tricarboxylate transporter substrate binding protein [Muricoccus radiodurans]|uniref:tripartite tricarboxylate transporter substrate binding protein n=1 Tax=Muricoccus radiodurans TaxID=2231721 RepID=UPI003CEDF4DF